MTLSLDTHWSTVLVIVASTAIALALGGCGGSGQVVAKSQTQPVVYWNGPPPESDDADKQAAGDILRIFLEPCVGRFPDDAALAQYAVEMHLAAMSGSEVAGLLGKDPGVGWVQHDPSGTYWLTVEKPPYHTCAVRADFAREPLALKSYFALQLSLMVAGAGTGDRLEEKSPQTLEQGGLPTSAYVFLRIDPKGIWTEQFIELVSARRDGTYAVRLVRQIAPR